MPFDRAALAQAVAAHGTVARIVLVQVKGSAPRPAGTSMLVWAGGASGTIGGGQLELQSMRDAAAMLAGGPRSKLTRAALGPASITGRDQRAIQPPSTLITAPVR